MARLNVLVVDDEDTIRLTLTYLLRKAGYAVSTCANAEEATQLVTDRPFFLVLVDLVLGHKGRLEGLDVVRTIKKNSPDTRVIVMTAYGSSEIKQKVAVVGADSYWDKPLDMKQLLENIRLMEPHKFASP